MDVWTLLDHKDESDAKYEETRCVAGMTDEELEEWLAEREAICCEPPGRAGRLFPDDVDLPPMGRDPGGTPRE